MTTRAIEVRIGGKSLTVPSVRIGNGVVIVTGTHLKVSSIMDEELAAGDIVGDPKVFASRLRESGLGADIFTFTQRVPDISPKYRYKHEWENAAIIPITTFPEWWEKRAQYDVRKAVKRAQKLGVAVTTCEFSDTFVAGVCGIYNESRFRQGKPFWHYQKPFETVKLENGTYLDRSEFIGAYYEGELIGFIKMVYVDSIAATLQVISQKRHADKKPTNALIAKAVEICVAKGVSHLVYGKYDYGNGSSSLSEFKRRNGFEKAVFPRYYIPLTLKGEIALALNLHRHVTEWLPAPMLNQARRIRGIWNSRKLQAAEVG